MDGKAMEEGKSLAITPTWALASVTIVMVSFGFFFQASLEHFGKWLSKRRSKRKALLSALEKIKDELMLFGLLSLLMGHWVVVVAKICVKSSSAMSSRFFPCAIRDELKILEGNSFDSAINYTVTNGSSSRDDLYTLTPRDYQCPEGHEPFASRESLEQIHRLMFVLGVIHVLYSFIAVILAMIKINSWHVWEKQAKSMANILRLQNAEDSQQAAIHDRKIARITTFVSRRTSHPWSHHKVLVWLLCFSRQFWSSINYADYMALQFGFITKHDLPLTYDFYSYMLRSMEESFREIVGISLPLWIYAICCIFLDFHETEVYFWLSFLPAILILAIGTKLHRVVVSLAVEITDEAPRSGSHHYQLNLRNELFWFGKPKLILWLIQLISFQNAFEMAAFIWSLWEVNGSSCFLSNKLFIGIRLTFGIVSQFWCSFITFPLYVIVTQMDAKFKKAVVSENVRESLHGWKRRVKAKHISSSSHSDNASSSSSCSSCNYKPKNKNTNKNRMDDSASTSSSKKSGSSSKLIDSSTSYHDVSDSQTNNGNETPCNELLQFYFHNYDDSTNGDDDDDSTSIRKG